jgi:hypothetical protein
MILTNLKSKPSKRLRSVLYPALSFVAWLIISSSTVTAQDRPVWLKPWGIPEGPLNCEENVIHMELAAQLASEESQRAGVIIAIARLGDGENLQELNSRRLHNVRVSLTDNLKIEPRRLVIASGQRVRGYGRIEFYLGGKLIGGLLVKRGKDLCVDCCDIDERYYPYRKRKKGVALVPRNSSQGVGTHPGTQAQENILREA